MSDGKGYRGYNTARPILGQAIPQHIQNIVIREAARQRGASLRLSVTEYAIENSFVMLWSVLDDLPNLDGIICYSLFMLPPQADQRARLWSRLLATGGQLIAAVENQEVTCASDIARVEDIWRVNQALPYCPTSMSGLLAP